MAKRYPNPRLIKIHRSYSVEEVAEALRVHKHTVRRWMTRGLSPLDNQRPILIQGRVLREWLTEQRKAPKRRMRRDEFYCLRCRQPRIPKDRDATYTPQSKSTGRMTASCSVCGVQMNRAISHKAAAALSPTLKVTIQAITGT